MKIGPCDQLMEGEEIRLELGKCAISSEIRKRLAKTVSCRDILSKLEDQESKIRKALQSASEKTDLVGSDLTEFLDGFAELLSGYESSISGFARALPPYEVRKAQQNSQEMQNM